MTHPIWIATAATVLCLTASAPAAAQVVPLPDDVVARVGEEPIAKREFRHWLRVSLSGQDGGPAPKALRDEVMRFLLQAEWVRQETAARGIVVKPRQVRRSFERQKRAAFPNERDYRQFLRESGQTEADILERVELDLLQRRLSRAASASAPPVTKEDVDRYFASHRRRYRDVPRRRARRGIRRLLTARREQRAIDRFIRDFRARYRAITVCADGYVVAECGNAQPAAAG
jgi:SurA-like protein